MLEWINNPWVVGIGAAIPGGLVVFILTRVVFGRKDRGEYLQKLRSANREIIYALRPGISSGYVPNRQVVESLINATARKYSVDSSEIHNPAQISEELIKEILDSTFISAEAKEKYCKQLDGLVATRSDPLESDTDLSESQSRTRSNLEEYRSQMVKMMSVMLAAITAIMTLVLGLRDDPSGSTKLSIEPLLPVAVTSVTVVLMTVTMLLYKRVRMTGQWMEASRENKEDHQPVFRRIENRK